MKRIPVIHPFLFAVFPVFYLYAHNIKSIPISLNELLWPLIGSVAGAIGLWLVLIKVIKSPERAGIAVSLIIMWFFSFGRIAEAISEWTSGVFDKSLFFASLILLGGVLFLVIRSRRDFPRMTMSLNVIAATLVALNLGSAGLTLARRTPTLLLNDVAISAGAASRPNIYYIVLDAYTRGDILKELFDYDNSTFLAELENMGFYIASKSYSNYSQTHHSFASSLNFSYLDHLAKEMGTGSSDREPLYRMIQDNRVMAFLKGHGYRIVTVSSGMWPTDIKEADRYIGFKRSPSEFLHVFLNTTPLPLFLDLTIGVSEYDAHRERILHAFDSLARAPDEKGPFFLFAHIMAPHPPFVFGPNGEHVRPDYAFSLVDADRMRGESESAIRDYIRRYRDQLIFINIKTLETIQAVLCRSALPPVIILQGDHGSRAYADLDRPEASNFRENLAILNAYHLPGLDQSLLYPAISPVNTFRLLFREYFGAELELLEDKSFWNTWRRPYRFIPFDE